MKPYSILLIMITVMCTGYLHGQEATDDLHLRREYFDEQYRKKRIKALKNEKKRLEQKIAELSYEKTTDYAKDQAKATKKELSRESREIRKELRDGYRNELKKLNQAIDNAETDREYQKLLADRQELQKNYRGTVKGYRDTEYIEEQERDAVQEFEDILNNLEPDSLTFVTNGTRISKQGTVDEYFFDEQREPDSAEYSEEFGTIFKTERSYFLSWKGENNDPARRAAARKFVAEIKQYCARESRKSGHKAKTIPINLVGHSHGGNIMILVANALLQGEYNVQFLLTLNTPVREYLPEYSVDHVQLFSYDDAVQKIGGWDFDFLWQDLDYHGPAGRKFKNAVNININYFLDYDTFSFYMNDFLKLYRTGRNYYHQVTRYLGIIEKIILAPDEGKHSPKTTDGAL